MIDVRLLDEVDPDLADLVKRDAERQRSKIQLIASENFVSVATMQASGSVFTNKYSEGYPGRRYYEGCEVVDEMETLAIERAKSLFGAAHANVQAHSGSQANIAAYLAVLDPGDTILGMRLDQGGHLTHGSPVNLSGKLFDFVAYRLDRRDRDDRPRRGAAAGARASAEDDRGRLHGILAVHRLGGLQGDRRRSRGGVSS